MRLLFLLFLLPQLAGAQSGPSTVFFSSLDDAAKSRAALPFTSMTRYDWHYLPGSMFPRNGIPLKDLTAQQRDLVQAMLEAFLSKPGHTRAKAIMDYEYLLRDLDPANPHRVPENYFIALYGTPDGGDPWGWKLSGHHLALNFTFVDGRIAVAPFFFGVYPAEIREGPRKGERLLGREEDLGLALVNALTKEQQALAVLSLEAFTDIVTGNAKLVAPLPEAGITAEDMTPEQRNLLYDLISTYMAVMPDDIAKERMERIAAEKNGNIRFSWAGGFTREIGHYYRVQGKSFMLEFDNTQGNANHIHIVWRDFAGDYGEDLLHAHYARDHKH